MKFTNASGAGAATEFNFVPPTNYHHPLQSNSPQQQGMFPMNYESQFATYDQMNHDNYIPQYQPMVSIPNDIVPVSQPIHTPTIPFQPPHQFYQQHSYSQPELQHISQYSKPIAEVENPLKHTEEVTIESILEDDPLLSFTNTLDRQESNDTILQSSSPVKGPSDLPQQEIENLDLNNNHSQTNLNGISTGQMGSPTIMNIPTPMNSFPTPANSTPSTVLPAQSPSASQLQFQTFQVQYPSQQPFQPPQAQFTLGCNSSSGSLPLPADEVVPVSNTSSNNVEKSQAQQHIPAPQNFRIQMHNPNTFAAQQSQQVQQPQQKQFAATTAPVPQVAPAPSKQSAQQFFISRPPLPQQTQSESIVQTRFKEVTTVPGKQIKMVIKTSPNVKSEAQLPPTPPAQRAPPHSALNKSSSTTKLNKVKKGSVSGPSSNTLKLKKSKSFLNSSPSLKDSGPMFATLDFSKKLNNSTNFINNKDKRPLKGSGPSSSKTNVIKNYEFVMEPGREKIKAPASASNSVKSTPRKSSNVDTPTSATSLKFPKLPKPPPIEQTSFSVYSPSNTNSSPTGSDASGHSPLTSSQQYPFVNQSPIPSSIARFDSSEPTSSPLTDQFLFGSARRGKKSSVSTHFSPDKDHSPTSKQGMTDFKFHINE